MLSRGSMTKWGRLLRRAVNSVAIGVLTAIVASQPAHARVLQRTLSGIGDSIHNILMLRPRDTLDWRLGVGPYVAPVFEGSKDYTIKPAPVISVTIPKVMRVDDNNIDFIAFDQVIEVGDSTGKFEAGPAVNFDFGRGESDSPALRGLGNVGFSLELGGYVGFTLGPAKLNLEISQDVLHGHKGAIADLSASFILIERPRFTLGASVLLTWASARYMKSFFGINAVQSAASGLPTYRAGGGLKNGGVSLHASYDLSRHWSILGNLGYERLLTSAAESPLVKLRGSPDQITAGTFVVYVF